MEQWEIDYRKVLSIELPEGLYTIGEASSDKLIAQTGKGGYIDYLVEVRKQSYEVFDRPALEKRLQELTQIPEVGQLELSSFPDIFLKTGVPVPEQYKWETLKYGTSDFEAGQGLLAQIEQGPALTYESLTPRKVEEIITDLFHSTGNLMIDKTNWAHAAVPTSENQEKL